MIKKNDPSFAETSRNIIKEEESWFDNASTGQHTQIDVKLFLLGVEQLPKGQGAQFLILTLILTL